MKLSFKKNLSMPFYPMIMSLVMQSAANEMIKQYGLQLLGIIVLFALMREFQAESIFLNKAKYILPGVLLLLWMAGIILRFT